MSAEEGSEKQSRATEYRQISFGVFFHIMGFWLVRLQAPQLTGAAFFGFIACTGLGVAYWFPAVKHILFPEHAKELEAEHGVDLEK